MISRFVFTYRGCLEKFWGNFFFFFKKFWSWEILSFQRFEIWARDFKSRILRFGIFWMISGIQGFVQFQKVVKNSIDMLFALSGDLKRRHSWSSEIDYQPAETEAVATPGGDPAAPSSDDEDRVSYKVSLPIGNPENLFVEHVHCLHIQMP